MDRVIALLAVSGATVFSIVIALILECLLLRVILKYVARAHVDEPVTEVAPDQAYRELKSAAR